MKAIKIIFVFILILGGVVGAFLIIGGGGGTFITPIEDNELQTYREQFESNKAEETKAAEEAKAAEDAKAAEEAKKAAEEAKAAEDAKAAEEAKKAEVGRKVYRCDVPNCNASYTDEGGLTAHKNQRYHWYNPKTGIRYKTKEDLDNQLKIQAEAARIKER